MIGSSSPFSDYTIAPLQGWGSALPSLGVSRKRWADRSGPPTLLVVGLTMIISLPTADHPLTSDPESVEDQR